MEAYPEAEVVQLVEGQRNDKDHNPHHPVVRYGLVVQEAVHPVERPWIFC